MTLLKYFAALALLFAAPAVAAPITIEMQGRTTGITQASDPVFVSAFRAATGISSDIFDITVRFDIEAAPLRPDAPVTVLPVQNVQFMIPNLSGVTTASRTPYNILNLADGQFAGFNGTDTIILNAAITSSQFGGGQFFVDFGVSGLDPSLVQSPFDPATIVNWSGNLHPFISQLGGPIFGYFSNDFGFRYLNQFSTAATFRIVSNQPVSEPGTVALCFLGFVTLMARRKRACPTIAQI
jgi:hypothetical protein